MADVQFEEEQQYQQNYQAEQKPFMIRLVLATHIVSTDDAAKYVLLGVAALAIIIAFFVPSFIGGTSAPKAPSGANVMNTSGEPPRLTQPVPVR